MRIALIGPIYPFRGGIAHYTAKLVQVLSNRNETKVFSFKHQYPAWLYSGRSDKDPSPKVVDVNVAYTIDPLNPLSWTRTVKEIQFYRPDILVIEWWVTFFAPVFTMIAWFFRQSNIPVIFLIHNVLPHEKSWLHRPLAWITLKQGSLYIVHTSKERERLLSLIPHGKVIICPFPIYDMLAEPTSLTQAEARCQLNIPETGRVLLFFGIVRQYKGLIYLLEAMRLLQGKITDLYLIIAGEIWKNKADYEQKIKSLGLSEFVQLHDRYIPDEELGVFFRAADLSVAPYVSGTQSAVAALSLGYGIPLLATEWSAAGIDKAYNAMVRLVPSGDARALADAIQTFFESHTSSQTTIPLSASKSWEILVEAIEKIAKKN